MQEIKNIIIINDFDFINGGTSQIAISTANILAESGLNVVFFSAVHNKESSDLSDKIMRICTNQWDILHDPKKWRSVTQGIWNYKAAEMLTELLKQFNKQQTVVHLHGWIKALSPSIGKALVKSKFPVICTLHDYFLACPNGGLYNFNTNTICHLKPMGVACICTNCDSRNYAQKLWRVARQSVQKSIGEIPSGIKNFIMVSDFSRKILQQYLPATAKVFNIGNPISYPFDKPLRASVSSTRILYVGRLSQEKGAILACMAARKLGIKLSIIGDGDQRVDLQRRFPEVEFMGWMKPLAVFNEMLNSKALVFPSLLYETQGLAVLEALSVGLPVIVSADSAASEFVKPENGLLFKSGDVDDLSAKISLIYSNPEKAERMSINAFEGYWAKPFSLNKYVAALMEVYAVISGENDSK